MTAKVSLYLSLSRRWSDMFPAAVWRVGHTLHYSTDAQATSLWSWTANEDITSRWRTVTCCRSEQENFVDIKTLRPCNALPIAFHARTQLWEKFNMTLASRKYEGTRRPPIQESPFIFWLIVSRGKWNDRPPLLNSVGAPALHTNTILSNVVCCFPR